MAESRRLISRLNQPPAQQQQQAAAKSSKESPAPAKPSRHGPWLRIEIETPGVVLLFCGYLPYSPLMAAWRGGIYFFYLLRMRICWLWRRPGCRPGAGQYAMPIIVGHPDTT